MHGIYFFLFEKGHIMQISLWRWEQEPKDCTGTVRPLFRRVMNRLGRTRLDYQKLTDKMQWTPDHRCCFFFGR